MERSRTRTTADGTDVSYGPRYDKAVVAIRTSHRPDYSTSNTHEKRLSALEEAVSVSQTSPK